MQRTAGVTGAASRRASNMHCKVSNWHSWVGAAMQDAAEPQWKQLPVTCPRTLYHMDSWSWVLNQQPPITTNCESRSGCNEVVVLPQGLLSVPTGICDFTRCQEHWALTQPTSIRRQQLTTTQWCILCDWLGSAARTVSSLAAKHEKKPFKPHQLRERKTFILPSTYCTQLFVFFYEDSDVHLKIECCLL